MVNLPPAPSRIAALKVDERGYPVPYFVAWIDGKPEFRVADRNKLINCITAKRCWICGDSLGKHQTFVVGPMCVVNRVSAEPPSHKECAVYAVQACPFLAMPKAKRNEQGLPGGTTSPGIMIKRNPGVSAIWTSSQPYAISLDHNGKGFLFNLPDFDDLQWWTEGRQATREEVEELFDAGLPSLEALCETDDDREELAKLVIKAREFFPDGVPEMSAGS